ncbi:7TM diverse intracellular signaling domain-containing protein [Tenacibaculum finnmarkense]|uniref:7TM diverse intracellular signaling domain-containing protein n=1 Tax=Tenacibaculum finnmarkense TaxID=2781243 RepID=UPI00187B2786|nr:7TM diverse intracellular signaling domain-containing protein [Tenacibaculum finnmarkense]MBE7659199.1 hypothetical protein [Tenacibaculum finnmarkense genomovar finnmarkense]MCG8251290.1 ATP-binding protein [Tenacibaculum finnmarkense genomovar finnmarkense]MCG8814404.1 hypothetical protein [Tenacibaculum finnmarkense]MCG8819424.1 hypothetical protein [Tenacibaculum finnmarkense]
MFRLFYTLLFFLLVFCKVTAQNKPSNTPDFNRNNFKISYLVERLENVKNIKNQYSFEKIKNFKEAEFTATSKTYINLGITKSTLWVKIKLRKTNLSDTAILIVQTPLKDSITLCYSLKNGEQIQELLGVTQPHSKNKFNHWVPAFEIPVSNLKTPTIYLKIKSRYSMKVPIVIKTKETFYKDRVTEYFISGLLIGGLILMGIYNLFLFFSTRDFSYLLYVIALFSAVLSQGYLFGILIQYLSPEHPEFSFRFPIVIMAITGVFSSLFAIQFLELKNTNKILYRILILLIILSCFNIFLELFKLDYLSRKISIALIITTSTVILTSAIYSLIKGKKVALYFTIAWSFYLSGMIIYALQSLGLLVYNQFTEHIMHVGTFLEVVLLSFALGHKYQLVQQDKERLEQQTRAELEQLVKEQTLELEASLKEKEILLKEIHHRVKNNLQIVISLLDLQKASIKDAENKEVLDQIKDRIYSMSLIHQKLYQSDNLSHVNTKSYIEELFLYIKNSHSDISQKITHVLTIENRNISLTKSVPLGLIINELLTNSFKYGIQKNKENRIEIALFFKDGYFNVLVADSGAGFDEKSKTQAITKSLGLFLIKSLTKQLRGTLKRYYTGDLFVTEIKFPI